MSRLKKFVRKIGVVGLFLLLLTLSTPLVKVSAQETKETMGYTVEVGKNAVIEYEETASIRIVKYYENGTLLQKSVYNLETGEIVCYDLSKNTNDNDDYMSDAENENMTVYYIRDFKTIRNAKASTDATTGRKCQGKAYVVRRV